MLKLHLADVLFIYYTSKFATTTVTNQTDGSQQLLNRFSPRFSFGRGMYADSFIHSFIRGGGWPLAAFRRAFQPTASAEA